MADTEMTSLADTSAKPVYRAIPRGPLVAVSLLAGLAIAILWSAQLFDDDIGVNSANGILGHDSLTTSISGSAAGVLFAFTAGLAGSFTACNVAAFSAIAPLMEDAPSAATRLKLALRPLAWLAAGLIGLMEPPYRSTSPPPYTSVQFPPSFMCPSYTHAPHS
jgi:hypothetical protein